MKKEIILCLIFIASTSLMTLNSSYKENKMESFNWLIGSWVLETKRGAIMETWVGTDDSTLSGESVRINISGGTELLEKIQLVYRRNNYFYIPEAQGQNNNQPVTFEIKSFSKAAFVAENPEHDFPKRIRYTLVSKDAIHAIIDGGASMPEKKSDFYFTRLKN